MGEERRRNSLTRGRRGSGASWGRGRRGGGQRWRFLRRGVGARAPGGRTLRAWTLWRSPCGRGESRGFVSAGATCPSWGDELSEFADSRWSRRRTRFSSEVRHTRPARSGARFGNIDPRDVAVRHVRLRAPRARHFERRRASRAVPAARRVCCGFARATPTAPRAASTPYVASRARWRTTARTNSPLENPGDVARDPARDALAPSAVFDGVARADRCLTAAAADGDARFYVSTVLGGDAAALKLRGTHLRRPSSPTTPRTARPRGSSSAPTPVGHHAKAQSRRKNHRPAELRRHPHHPHRPGALTFPSRARRSRRTHRPRRVFRHVAPPTQRS